jgi:hypothetical protein
MFRQSRHWRWLLGVGVLGVILGSAEGARAAGITITGGGIKAQGDPFYFYIVEVYLDPGFTFAVGDSFTLLKLAGVEFPLSTTGAPGGVPSGPWSTTITNQGTGPIPNFSPPTIVPLADVQFINAGFSITNAGTGELYLGEFRALTAVSLPTLPDNYTVDIAWTASLNGGTAQDQGIVTLGMIHPIPEPASVALLGSGIGLVTVGYARRRRKA